MTNDLLGSLFELQDSRVDRLGNPLVELDEMIDWDGFRKILNRVNKIPIKGKAGAKPKDVVMMFKGLVIQNLYGLSETKQKANRKKSKVPSRVEPIFGAQSNLRKQAIRSIGIARAQTEIGMMNVVYNMMRYCFLSRVSTS